MSKLLKATKKITAVAASTLLLSSATFSAGLNDYGSNFVKDSKFVGQVVVGSSAGADDMTAANLIVNQLKAKYSGSEAAYTLSYTKSDGKVGSSVKLGDDLFYGTNLSSEESSFDHDELSYLKEDAIVKLEDGTEVQFSEKLAPSNGEGVSTFMFDWNDNLKDVGYTSSKPTPFVKLNSEPLYVLSAEFDSGFKVVDSSGKTTGTDLDKDSVRGQSINLFGNEFVFANKNKANSDLELFTATNTISLTTIGGHDSASITYEGKQYTIKVIDANEDSQEALISVNGVNGYLKTDDSSDISGLNIFVKKVFVGNTVVASGKKILSVDLFVGGNSITIPKEAVSKFTNLKVGSEELENYYVKVDMTQNNPSNFSGDVKAIRFAYKPQEGDNSIDYIVEGKVLQDPFFKEISFKFNGYSPKIGTGDNEVKFDVSSDKGTIKYTPVGSSRAVTLNLVSLNKNIDKTKSVLEYHTSSSENFKVYNALNATNAILALNKINSTALNLSAKANKISVIDGLLVIADLDDVATIKTAALAELTGTEVTSANKDDDSTKSATLAARTKYHNALTNLIAKNHLLIENDVFILDEKENKDEEAENGIFKIESFDGNVGDDDASVKIKNLVTGSSKVYKIGEDVQYAEITALVGAGSSSGTFETGNSQATTSSASKVSSLQLSKNTISTLVSKGGLQIDIGKVLGITNVLSNVTVNITEFSSQDGRDSISNNEFLGTVRFGVNGDGDEVKVGFTKATTLNVVENDIEDTITSISKTGTYVEEFSDSDSTSFKVNVPTSQRIFSAEFVTGQSSTVMSETVPASKKDARKAELMKKYGTVSETKLANANVEFTVTAPVKDSEATAKDNIVVGGPMVNSKAVSLLNGAQTLVKGEAMVRYFAGSNSILAYGYTKAGTLEAVKSLNSGATNGAKITVKE